MSMAPTIAVVSTAETLRLLDLSLHGIDVWRSYRNGMNPALMDDLYGAAKRNYDNAVQQVCATIALHRGQVEPRAYMRLLAQLIQTHLATLPPEVQQHFSKHWFMLHREVHELFLPDFLEDEEDYFYAKSFMCVKQFITYVLMIDGYDDDTDEITRNLLAPLWFAICDVALANRGQVA